MLLLHEVHTVAGRHEDEFEAAFRDGWMPTLGRDDDARLLYFLKLAHGTGRAYHLVTITALRDGAAYERLASACNAATCAVGLPTSTCSATRWPGKLLLPVDWSPMQDLDLTTVPADGREHDAALYMEDSAWPLRRRARPLPREGAHALRARASSSAPRDRCSRCSACSRPRWARPGGAKSCCGNASTSPTGCPGLFTRELPAHVKGPGTWMHDALEVRDDWESRLLRSTTWSPFNSAAIRPSTPVSRHVRASGSAADSRRSERSPTSIMIAATARSKNTAVHGARGAGGFAGAGTESTVVISCGNPAAVSTDDREHIVARGRVGRHRHPRVRGSGRVGFRAGEHAFGPGQQDRHDTARLPSRGRHLDLAGRAPATDCSPSLRPARATAPAGTANTSVASAPKAQRQQGISSPHGSSMDRHRMPWPA